MKLTGEQIGELNDILCDAFTRDELTILLRRKLDFRFDNTISAAEEFQTAAFQLIDSFDREERAVELIRVVREARPGVARVAKFCDPLLAGAVAAAASSLTQPPVAPAFHREKFTPSIFISYRRKDRPSDADRIHERLTRTFGAGTVFKDVDNIPAGTDFLDHIKLILPKCQVVLVIIGPQWNVVNQQGMRRLDSQDDYVRQEVELALERRIPLIPIVVAEATMPMKEDLPSSIAKLARINCRQVRSGRDFDKDMDWLKEDIELYMRSPQTLEPPELLLHAPAPVEPPQVPRKALERSHGGRVQLTAVHCKLHGIEVFATQAGAQAASELSEVFAVLCKPLTQTLSGHVVQNPDTEALIYFWRLEDDVHVALRSALALVTEFQRRVARADAEPCPVRVRVGVHTEITTVVETAGRAKPFVSSGMRPILYGLLNLDAGIGVYLSEAAYDLVKRRFQCEDLARRVGEGEGAVAAFRVVREKELDRFVAGPRLTPLIGRSKEFDQLLELWEEAKQGRTQIAFVSGHAGYGKSRILHELCERLNGEEMEIRRWQCLEHFKATDFYPMVDMLQRALQFGDEDSNAEKLAKIKNRLTADEYPHADTVPLLANLLKVGFAERYQRSDLSSQAMKEQTLRLLVGMLQKLSRPKPVLILGEDLHWCDPSTLELIGRVLLGVKDSQILMVLTHRPAEFTWPDSWPRHDNQTSIQLKPLGAKDTKKMIAQIAGKTAVPAETMRELAERVNGVPLFAEELTAFILENPGNTEIPAELIPLLKARLDRLGAAKDTAQMAAVIGREFTFELLHAVSSLDAGELQVQLNCLVEAEIVYHVGLSSASKFSFKHALHQEAAYESLDDYKRRALHGKIAAALKKTAPPPPELLAHHLTEAGLHKQAVPCWLKAGRAAVKRSANLEAISHCTKGLDLIPKLDKFDGRDKTEFALLSRKIAPMVMTQGFNTKELRDSYDSLLELAERLGDPAKLFEATRRKWVYEITSSSFPAALKLARRLSELADGPHRIKLRVEADYALGYTQLFQGKPDIAEKYLREVMDGYDEADHADNRFLYGHDPGVAAGVSLGLVLHQQARFQNALSEVDRAIQLARKLGPPYNLASALFRAAIVYHQHRDTARTESVAKECVEISHDQKFPIWGAAAKVYSGWAKVQNGHREEGLELMKDGAEKWLNITMLWYPCACWMLSEAHLLSGDLDASRRRRVQGLLVIRQTKETLSYSEYFRLKAKYLEAASKSPEAERALSRAILIAHRQGCKYFEIRARLDLAKHFQQHGRIPDAYQTLEPVEPYLDDEMPPSDVVEARELFRAFAPAQAQAAAKG